jgi:AraC-like DNA-binding protein
MPARPDRIAQLSERPDRVLERSGLAFPPPWGRIGSMPTDPLSDVLRAVRLSGAYFFLVDATHPWSMAAKAACELAPRVLPDAEHLISYHVVTSGSCWGGLEGEPPMLLEAGDAIVFPQGDPHVMASVAGRGTPVGAMDAAPGRYPQTLRIGGSAGQQATFVCGFLGCDVRPYNPILSALPRCMRVRGVAGGFLSEFPRQVVAESRVERAGSETMLTRMAELMFIEVLRRHVEQLPAEQTGWLAGLRDSVVAPALAQLHENPTHAWTLAELAHAVATSRTVLAERFSRMVGIPPMQYLTQWRLQLAAEQLAGGSAKVAAIGARVGYESEAAFSRAFKRATGHAPGAWRRERHLGRA